MAAINIETFKEKAGPLPVWAWVALAGGVVYLIYKHRVSASAANAAASADTQTSNTGDMGYAGALLTADYDMVNSLGVLNSNVGNATTAINSNTKAENSNTVAVGKNTAVEAREAQQGKWQTYRIQPNDTLVSLAQIYYGKADNNAVASLRLHNPFLKSMGARQKLTKFKGQLIDVPNPPTKR